MKRIMFVDDEPMVLTGLRRMLRGLRSEWEMAFYPGGEEALAAMADAPCDVIVSDMRMPGMDGVQLLTAVKADHPNTVRIALSGHADMEMVLECIGATHQYLAKPCDAETVKTTIDRACALRDLINDESMQKLVTEMASLPSLPTLYSEVMAAVRDGKALTEVGEIIDQDVAMTAKVLKVVNSAFFGLNRHVESPGQAAAILGLDAVRGLVLTAKVFADVDTSALDLERLWDHSAKTGALARRVAEACGQPRKQVDCSQMAGMLHDIGRLVLASQFPERYKKVVAARQQSGVPDWQCEQDEFGHDHTAVGAYLLGLWGLPNPIVEAAAFHHRPQQGAGEKFSPLTAVHVADSMLRAMRENGEPEQAQFDNDYLARLGLQPDQSWFDLAREVVG